MSTDVALQSEPTPTAHLAIDAADLRKVYGPTTALAGAHLRVRAGEIHGLLGENGAGKSTLVRILAGVESPDGGELRFFGVHAGGGPGERRDAGLAFIHQDLGLIAELSVADNLALATGYRRRWGFIDQATTNSSAQDIVEGLGFDFDVTRLVGELPVADQTAVAICRALAGGARLIVLDEPTAYLEARQVQRLFSLLARLRDEGVACVLISHRTDDILRTCDRVTVLRDGRTVAERSTEGLSETELIALITGLEKSDALSTEARADEADATVRVSVDELRGGEFGPVSFKVHEGEVLGLCGLADAGQFAVGRALIGDVPVSAGIVALDGKSYRLGKVQNALGAGIGFVPAERRTDGLASSLSAFENILMNPEGPWWQPLRTHRDRSLTQRLMEAFRVSPPFADREVGTFSGGNQQKILLAKWLGFDRRFTILNEPSAGVDVGAKADIHAQIRDTCNRTGTAALVITTDFNEIAQVCDRALVMRRGLIVGELRSSELRPDLLIEMAYGGTL